MLAELQGLAQDSKGNTEHAIKVKENAAMAVDFLQEKFSSKRDPKLQALTNQGSVLNTLLFQSQFDMGDKVREF